VAHSISAKKRIRQNATRRARNRWRKGQVRDAVRGFETALQAGDLTKAAEQLKACYKTLDHVAAKGTLHRNAAARKKSRLARKLLVAGR